MTLVLAALLAIMLAGGVFAFSGGDAATKKRVAAVARPGGQARGGGTINSIDNAAARRKNVAVMLKDIEKNQVKEKPTMRRRLEQAGFFKTSPRTYWIASAGLGL